MIFVQGITKYISCILKSKHFYVQGAYLQQVYHECSYIQIQNYSIMKKWSKFTEILFKVGVILTVLTAASFCLMPIALHKFTGERQYIAYAFLPFLNTETPHGYTLTVVHHIIATLIASVGTFAHDFTFIIHILHIKPLKDIFSNDLKCLNNALNEQEHDKTLIHELLGAVIKRHQDIMQ